MDSSRRSVRQWSSLFAIVFACGATACASTKGGVELMQPLATGFDAADFDRVGVNVDTAPQVEMMDYERERITQKIEQELRKRGLVSLAVSTGTTESDEQLRGLDIDVLMTRCDKGNSFARFILIGLAQIHIDADVTVREGSSGEVFGRYEVTKTFAWGGIYGAITEIDDVEEGFAKAVVSAIIDGD